MTDGHVRIQREGRVMTVVLDRPEKRNALTRSMLLELRTHIESSAADDRVAAVVLQGAGGAFSAGADLDMLLPPGGEPSAEDIEALLRSEVNPLILALAGLDKPVVAAITGVAAGLGLSLALAADVRVMARSASLVLAWTRIGLVPDGGASAFLPALLGPARAAELAWAGATIDADAATSLGLVSELAADDDVVRVSQATARRLAGGPRPATALTKRAMRGFARTYLEAALEAEVAAQAEAAGSADFREGVAAFRERRPARFGADLD